MQERRRSRAVFAAGDPLRAVAALSVAVSHVIGMAAITWTFDGGDLRQGLAGFGPAGDVVTSLGTVGVSIFFVLSGYLLARPFLRAAVLGERRPGLRRFTRNRVLRVVPAFWALLAVLVAALVLTGVEEASREELLRSFLFDWSGALPGWIGHTWTLDVEMRFYAALALAGTLVAQLARSRVPPRGRAAVVGVALLGVTLWSFGAHPPDVTRLPTGFGENVGRFCPGVALALLEVTAGAASVAERARWWAGGVFAAGLVGLVATSVARQDGELPLGEATPWLLALSSAAVVAGPLVWQWAGRPAWRALDNRPLRWAGSRSYSIYLVHLPVYAALMEAVPDAGYRTRAVLLATIGLPLGLVVAEAMHRWVERPFLRRRAPSQAAPPALGAAPVPAGGTAPA